MEKAKEPRIVKPRRLVNLKKNKCARYITRFVLYVLLIDLVFVYLYPFLYMLITSFKSPTDINDVSVHWVANEFYVGNYTLSWGLMEYPLRLLRSIGLAVICTLGHVISCSFIGYGFARFRFKGRQIMFILLLLSMIVPTETILAPNYIFFSQLKLVDSIWPIVLPSWFGFGLKGALFVFIFRQFYSSLPKSLEEAAQVDGCGAIRTFFSIVFPSSRSSVMVCMVLSLVWHWNDYLEPLIYITKDNQKLLPMVLPGLYDLINQTSGGIAGGADLSSVFTKAVAMAATVLVVVPIFIVYMFLQKQFIQGVERSGITGE